MNSFPPPFPPILLKTHILNSQFPTNFEYLLPPPPSMQCKLDRATIYYETYGEGVPLLTLHGFPLDLRSMKGCLEPIFPISNSPHTTSHDSETTTTQRSFQRIYFDLPGMGRTELHSELTSSDDIFSIVMEFIDTILPDSPFLLAGHSYGGYLARGIVKQRPLQVLGLLLICPLIEPDQSKRILPPRTVLHRDESLAKILTETEQEEFDYGATIQTETIWMRYEAEIMAGVKVAQLELLERLAEKSYPLSFDVDNLTTPFTGPSLFLLGKQDSVVGYEDALKLKDRYPEAKMVVMDRAGHSLEIEQPEQFNQQVREWLGQFI